MLHHSWESFLFGVSLDACVVAGNTFFLLSLLLFSSLPSPLFPRARRVYKQTRLLQQVFLMGFGLSSVCPRSFGFPFIGSHRHLFFPSFLSCLSVFMSLHPHPFFLLRVLSSGP